MAFSYAIIYHALLIIESLVVDAGNSGPHITWHHIERVCGKCCFQKLNRRQCFFFLLLFVCIIPVETEWSASYHILLTKVMPSCWIFANVFFFFLPLQHEQEVMISSLFYKRQKQTFIGVYAHTKAFPPSQHNL